MKLTNVATAGSVELAEVIDVRNNSYSPNIDVIVSHTTLR